MKSVKKLGNVQDSLFFHIPEFLDRFHNTFPFMRELGNVYFFAVLDT